jgi:hypothetical protein
VTGYRYGRQAARRPVGCPFIHNRATLPPAPAVFDHTHGFDGFKMLGNGPDPTLHANAGQPVGDCAFVGTVNVGLVDQAETGAQPDYPTADNVVSTYLTYDHGQDQGANLVDLLQFWQSHGLPWGGKIAAWASVDPHNPDRFWAACNAYGCLYVGIAVPATMDTQVENGQTLDLTGTPADREIMGGHCVVILSRDADGGELATWGQRVRFTQRWWDTYGEEAHVVITPAQVTAKGDGYGLDLDLLRADLAALR